MEGLPASSAGNSYFAPADGRCIINELPTELLSNIFLMGVEDDDDDDDDDSDDDDDDSYDSDDEGSTNSDDEGSDTDGHGGVYGEDDNHGDRDPVEGVRVGDPPSERTKEFEILVSHVCSRWRDIAVQTPALWANISFDFDGFNQDYAMSTEYLERSKNVPLSISIDLTKDESDDVPSGYNLGKAEMKRIQELVIPHISHWQSLEVMVSHYDPMVMMLRTLGDCAAAPLLKILELYHYEDEDATFETFQPEDFKAQPFVLFGGHAPRLTHVALWGVHLDWSRSRFLSGLTDLELAYHARDVRPSYADFARILHDSPGLTTLSLCMSGPAGGPVEWFESLQKADGREGETPTADEATVTTTTLTLDSLKELVLAYHELDYIMPLLDRLALPNLTSLTLDMEKPDSIVFLQSLTRPAPTTGKPLLSGITSLKLSGMPCTSAPTIADVYVAAPNLTSLNLDFNFLDDRWYTVLLNLETKYLLDPDPLQPMEDPPAPPPPEKIFLPRLETLTTSGLDGALMCKLVEARRQQGVPLKRVLMDERDDVEQYEDWLRANVQEFKLFEGSDTESVVETDEDYSESDGFDEDSDDDSGDSGDDGENDPWGFGPGGEFENEDIANDSEWEYDLE